MAWCLERFAEIAYEQQDFLSSVQIFACADSLRTSIGSVIDPVDQAEYETKISNIEAELGKQSFSQEWQAGQNLDLDEIIALATRASLSQLDGARSPVIRI